MVLEAYLWKTQNKKGKYPIRIRLTENRKTKYVSVGYAILYKYWNDNTKRVRESYVNHKEANNLIENELKELSKFKNNNDLLKRNQTITFLQFFDDHIANLRDGNKVGDYRKHTTVRNHLASFIIEKYKKTDIQFDDINYFFLEKLKSHWSNKGLKLITTNSYFKKIRYLYHKAIINNIHIPDNNPFVVFVNKKSPVKNKSLSSHELIGLMEFNPFTGYDNLSKQLNHIIDTPLISYTNAINLFNAKNLFIIQYYLDGIRISDFIYLKWSSINANNIICYKMIKTNTPIEIPLFDDLINYLRLYLPFEYKLEYLSNPSLQDDIEMYNSLSIPEKTIIHQKVISKEHFDNLIQDNTIFDTKNCDIIKILIQQTINSSYKDDYLFPLLNDRQKKQIEIAEATNNEGDKYKITMSATARYNKNLKLINKYVRYEDNKKIETNMVSHLARHTHTSLGVEDGTDILTLSSSLGHRSLNTTVSYVKTLNPHKHSKDIEISKKRIKDKVFKQKRDNMSSNIDFAPLIKKDNKKE